MKHFHHDDNPFGLTHEEREEFDKWLLSEFAEPRDNWEDWGHKVAFGLGVFLLVMLFAWLLTGCSEGGYYETLGSQSTTQPVNCNGGSCT